MPANVPPSATRANATPRTPAADTSCRTVVDGTTLMIRPHGDIDIATSVQLQHAVNRIRPGLRHVHVDMSDVAFMDSSGVRFLCRARSRSADVHAGFHLTGLNAWHRRLLTASGFTTETR